ncbi:MAG: hypothetical protein ABEJ34_01725 [Haloferacaceae archaeon]
MNSASSPIPSGLPRRRDRDADRGQTPLDFAIGAGIFMVAVVFVVAFVPSLTAPFEQGAGERTAAADRIATKLAEGLLGSRARPGSLDADCTVGFFDDVDTACGYDAGTALTEQLGLPDYRNVEVEMLADLDGDGDEETLCHDASDEAIVREEAGACGDEAADVPFRVSTGGTSASTAVSRRSVAVETTGATMVVRVW